MTNATYNYVLWVMTAVLVCIAVGAECVFPSSPLYRAIPAATLSCLIFCLCYCITQPRHEALLKACYVGLSFLLFLDVWIRSHILYLLCLFIFILFCEGVFMLKLTIKNQK